MSEPRIAVALIELVEKIADGETFGPAELARYSHWIARQMAPDEGGAEHAQTTKVKVATENGTVEVEGEVFGLWALTPKVEGRYPSGGWWTFTHVPTGRSTGGLAYDNKAEVRRFVQYLSERFSGPEWDTEDTVSLDAPEQKALLEAVNSFREYMLIGGPAPWDENEETKS